MLTEFGLDFAQSPDALRLALADTLEDASNELPAPARMAPQRAHLQWIELECQIAWCDERINAQVQTDTQAAQRAALVRPPLVPTLPAPRQPGVD